MANSDSNSGPIFRSTHDADDFDALLMRRRVEAGLPYLDGSNTEADNYAELDMWAD